jgi:hypothetical protein
LVVLVVSAAASTILSVGYKIVQLFPQNIIFFTFFKKNHSMMRITFILSVVLVAVYSFFGRPNAPADVTLEQLGTLTQSAEQKMLCGPLTTQEVIDLAVAFKATLTAAQISTTQFNYSLTDAKKWSNLPDGLFNGRIGIKFSALNATQLAAAKALIRVASGAVVNEGYSELEQMRAADDYLAANGGGSNYGSGQYYLALLGTPSLTGTWELQTGGHHVAFANTMI